MKKAARLTLLSVLAILPVLLAFFFEAQELEPQVSPAQTTAKVAAPKPLNGPIPILERATGKCVGYKDPKTGNLVFTTRNRVIRRGRIQQVTKEEFLRLMKKYGCSQTSISNNRLKMLSNSARMAQAAWDDFDRRTSDPNDDWYSGGGGGTGDSNQDCVDLCWVLAEGGAKCEGCCHPVGNGICVCWELCTDYMSSLEK